MRPTYSMNVPPSLFALEASIPDPKDKALKVEETSTPSSMITVRGRWRRTSHDVYTRGKTAIAAIELHGESLE